MTPEASSLDYRILPGDAFYLFWFVVSGYWHLLPFSEDQVGLGDNSPGCVGESKGLVADQRHSLSAFFLSFCLVSFRVLSSTSTSIASRDKLSVPLTWALSITLNSFG